jgi:hypothetical protein
VNDYIAETSVTHLNLKNIFDSTFNAVEKDLVVADEELG